MEEKKRKCLLRREQSPVLNAAAEGSREMVTNH